MSTTEIQKEIEAFDPWLEKNEGVKMITDGEICDQSRWETTWAYVIEYKNHFWEVCVSRGSTEMQDGNEEICNVQEVEQKEVTEMKWVPVEGETHD